jgi:hypothetical protein
MAAGERHGKQGGHDDCRGRDDAAVANAAVANAVIGNAVSHVAIVAAAGGGWCRQAYPLKHRSRGRAFFDLYFGWKLHRNVIPLGDSGFAEWSGHRRAERGGDWSVANRDC